jgi:hypothetical protein
MQLVETYVIHYSEYAFRDEAPRMVMKRCTWRELLCYLSGDERNEFPTMSDAELVEAFNITNGEGAPWVMVFSVERNAVVLGGEETK